MKKIESGKDLNKLDGVVYELYQLNALIGFMQVAFAEGPSATDEEEAASAALAAENAKKAAGQADNSETDDELMEELLKRAEADAKDDSDEE